MMFDLGDKSIDIAGTASKAIKDDQLLAALLKGILSKKDAERFNSFKVLLLISQDNPEFLYPKWTCFTDLLDSDNSYLKYIALFLITNLTKVDVENKFEKIMDKYFGLLDEEGTMVSANLAANAGKIAKAKPHLQEKITEKLLSIDDINRGKQKELIKGYAVEAFGEYFEEAKDKKKIIEFVREQLNSKSPKTRKTAEKFFKKWD